MEIIYGKSLLYTDGEEEEEVKKINEHLTILYFLQEENKKTSYGVDKMVDILTNTVLQKSIH